MSAATLATEKFPAAGLVRPDDAEDERLMGSIQAQRLGETDRRLGIKAAIFGGWAAAFLFAGGMFWCLDIIANRPLPKDKVAIALVRQDGMTEAPVMADDMSASLRATVLSSFLYSYLHWRLEYTWENAQRNFDNARFTTAGQEQAAYIAFMRASPQRPDVVIGKGGMATLDDTSIRISDNGPNAAIAFVDRHVLLPNGTRKKEPLRVEISFATIPTMPSDLARRIDPAKTVVTRFSVGYATYDPAATPPTGLPQT